MAQLRMGEAVFTVGSGPLEDEEVAAALFVAIGEFVTIEPARYDLNRRDQWRTYGGKRLLVDLLTQRTQLVTIAEDRPVDEGGKMVVVATGKQGAPVQAVVRWLVSWPPGEDRIRAWEEAVVAAFEAVELEAFVFRVAEAAGDEVAGGAVRIGVVGDPQQVEAMGRAADGGGRPLSVAGGEGRVFFPGFGGQPPKRWTQWWSQR